MGEPKKLELTIEELIEIAIALNENTIANRTRSKEDKIPTDKLIKGFGINRKNFSVTIQGVVLAKRGKYTLRLLSPKIYFIKTF